MGCSLYLSIGVQFTQWSCTEYLSDYDDASWLGWNSCIRVSLMTHRVLRTASSSIVMRRITLNPYPYPLTMTVLSTPTVNCQQSQALSAIPQSPILRGPQGRMAASFGSHQSIPSLLPSHSAGSSSRPQHSIVLNVMNSALTMLVFPY